MKPRKPVVVIAAVAVVAVTALLGVRHFWAGDDNSLFASGTVEATDAQLGFQAAGRIVEVAVREGDSVKQGQVLARLDTREVEARLQQAQAQLRATNVRLAEARRDLKRAQTLFAGGAIGKEAFDKSRLANDVAKAERTQADAQVAAIKATLANMVITADIDGVVTVRHREPGEVVMPGAPVLTVMDPRDRWVRIYIPENRIGAVHIGQHASIYSDTYPDKTYDGEVVYIATEAEFTPKNVQTTEERVKLVYAVKVRIIGDEAFELKPGMPADVRIEEAAS